MRARILAPENRKWWTLVALCFSLFMIMLDNTVVNVALPTIRRGAAIGIWAGVSAMALAIGPLVGGLITEHINWNWIFYINVPIGALGLVAGRFVIAESRDDSAEQRLDLPGLIASGAALFMLTF